MVTNEKFATDALETVKKIADPSKGFRSSNKLYPSEPVEAADARRDKYTHSARVLGAKGLLPEEAAKQLVETGIANCTDLAWVASEEIRKATAEWSLVRAGIDHVFVAAGVDFDGRSVPKDPATWEPDNPKRDPGATRDPELARFSNTGMEADRSVPGFQIRHPPWAGPPGRRPSPALSLFSPGCRRSG